MARNPRADLSFQRPLTTVDLAIFTIRADALSVLLVRRPDGTDEPYPGAWALPGGFVDIEKDPSLVACARRKLSEKTAISTPYLEQVGSWGDNKRDPRGWSATHVYFALIPNPGDAVEPPQTTSNTIKWEAVDNITTRTRLAFDHTRLLLAALERLRAKVEYTSLPAFLLAEPFTLPQLQRVYEMVLGRPLDKSAFRTRAMAADFLTEDGLIKGSGPRPAMGYRLRDRRKPAYFPRTFSPRDK